MRTIKYLQPAVNRQPGYRRVDLQSGYFEQPCRLCHKEKKGGGGEFEKAGAKHINAKNRGNENASPGVCD